MPVSPLWQPLDASRSTVRVSAVGFDLLRRLRNAKEETMSRSEKVRRRQQRKEKKRRGESPLAAESARPGEVRVIRTPPGMSRMSEVLAALVEPEWDLCKDEEAYRKLLTLGLIAWNAALKHGAKRTSFLADMAQTVPSELRQDFYQIVEPLILRKEKLFPHIHRPILDFDLRTRASGEPYLSVVSGMEDV